MSTESVTKKPIFIICTYPKTQQIKLHDKYPVANLRTPPRYRHLTSCDRQTKPFPFNFCPSPP